MHKVHLGIIAASSEGVLARSVEVELQKLETLSISSAEEHVSRLDVHLHSVSIVLQVVNKVSVGKLGDVAHAVLVVEEKRAKSRVIEEVIARNVNW